MKKVLAIVGPTASGKSSFAVMMAHRLKAEIISADSVQVYRGMDIGSGKITKEQMQGIPHHLIDILSPKEPYSVFDFQQNARREIEDCKVLPILCGGTGLYLKSCLYDYEFTEGQTQANDVYEKMDSEALYELLKHRDPVQAEKIHPNNRRRVIRSLNIYDTSGIRQSDAERMQEHRMIYDVYLAGCTMERETLYARINERTASMFDKGLTQEVQTLLDLGVTFDDPGMQGIGYREFKAYYDGECTLTEVRELIQQHSRQFAKRQYTWLNHQMPVHWIQMDHEAEKQKGIEQIEEWYRTNTQGQNC